MEKSVITTNFWTVQFWFTIDFVLSTNICTKESKVIHSKSCLVSIWHGSYFLWVIISQKNVKAHIPKVLFVPNSLQWISKSYNSGKNENQIQTWLVRW